MTTTGIEARRRLVVGAALALLAGASGCYVVGSADPPPPCDPMPLPIPGSGGFPGVVPSGSGGAFGAGGGAGYSDAGLPASPNPPAACPSVSVDRFRELMLVDPSVIGDSRAQNSADDHTWSFRQRLEDLNADPAAAGPLADAWLDQWKSLTEVPVSTDPAAASIPITPRPSVDQVLRCPWLQQSFDNYCDAACGACQGRRLDLTQAPFRLLAIANRIDLAAGGACGSDGGELRFVYGVTTPGTMASLPMTVIFEYHVALRAGESLRDWATAWHALGAVQPGPALADQLATVVGRGLARATLHRVLTNDGAFGPPLGLPWEMRQFVPAATDAGVTRLLEVAVAQTPRLTLMSSADLGQWIDANASSVLAGDNKLDARFLASSAPIPTFDFAWHTAASDPAVNTAFNHNTCNGCHGGRTSDDIPFQHVAGPVSNGYYDPSGQTSVRLSKVLNNPGHDDELGRRERGMATVLCTSCGGAGGSTGGNY
jgi:hypothetical protein